MNEKKCISRLDFDIAYRNAMNKFVKNMVQKRVKREQATSVSEAVLAVVTLMENELFKKDGAD
jgi:hypothetical protein